MGASKATARVVQKIIFPQELAAITNYCHCPQNYQNHHKEDNQNHHHHNHKDKMMMKKRMMMKRMMTMELEMATIAPTTIALMMLVMWKTKTIPHFEIAQRAMVMTMMKQAECYSYDKDNQLTLTRKKIAMTPNSKGICHKIILIR